MIVDPSDFNGKLISMVIIFGFAWDKLSLLTILPIYTQRPPEVYTIIGLCEPTKDNRGQ